MNNVLRSLAITALALSSGCGGDPSMPSVAVSGVTLRDLGAPLPPVPFPLSAGNYRVSQRGNDFPSHGNNSTRNALDLPRVAAGATARAQVSGVVRRRPCNSNGTTTNCPTNGFGNVVEVEGRMTGQRYIVAHCDAFTAEAPDGAFVLRGTPICVIGNTGFSEAAHVHADRVSGATPSAYVSLGAQYVVVPAGQTSASVVTPTTTRTCCSSGCDAVTNTAACVTYASINTSLADVLSAMANERRARDPRIVGIVGSLTPDGEASGAQWTVARVLVDLATGGVTRRAWLYLFHGSYSGSGPRNPLIDTAYSAVWNGSSWDGEWQTHVRVQREDFVSVDLYDLARTIAPAASRDAVALVDAAEVPDWSAQWRLHRAIYTLGGRSYSLFLAVNTADRGNRQGIYWDGSAWSTWIAL